MGDFEIQKRTNQPNFKQVTITLTDLPEIPSQWVQFRESCKHAWPFWIAWLFVFALRFAVWAWDIQAVSQLFKTWFHTVVLGCMISSTFSNLMGKSTDTHKTIRELFIELRARGHRLIFCYSLMCLVVSFIAFHDEVYFMSLIFPMLIPMVGYDMYINHLINEALEKYPFGCDINPLPEGTMLMKILRYVRHREENKDEILRVEREYQNWRDEMDLIRQ